MNDADLSRIIEEKRQATPPATTAGHGGEWRPGRRREPGALGEALARVETALEAMPSPSPEECQRHRREQQAADRSARWRSFSEQLGPRYLGCRFANFEIPEGPHASAQHQVVSELQRYAEKLPERVEAGQGVLLFGASGTGKDHLLSALAHFAIVRFDMYVRWIDGTAFYRHLRDRLDSRDTEEKLIERFSLPSILYFSDPLPPFGELTSFQASALFTVLDRRYRDRRPTWFTLNVQNFDEASRRLSASIADRMRDNTLALRCAWPSYRKADA